MMSVDPKQCFLLLFCIFMVAAEVESAAKSWLFHFTSKSECDSYYDVCPNGECDDGKPLENIPSLEQCDNMCVRTSTCQFFTYHHKTALCQVKSHRVQSYVELPKTIENGKTSGVKGCTGVGGDV